MAFDSYKYWSPKSLKEYEGEEKKKPYTLGPQKMPGTLHTPETQPLGSYSALPQASDHPGNISKFVSFDRILNANTGAAKNMAGRLSDRVERNAETAKKQVSDLTRDFTDKSAKGRLYYNGSLQVPVEHETAGYRRTEDSNPGAVNPTTQLKQGMGGTPQRGQHAPGSASPHSVQHLSAGDSFSTKRTGLRPEDATVTGAPSKIYSIEEARELARRGYQGPNSVLDLAGYSPTEAAVAKAKRDAMGIGTHGGVQAILEDEYGKQQPGYSRAGSDLDAALAGAAGNERFQSLRSKYQGIDDLLRNAVKSSAQEGAAARSESEDVRRQVAGDVEAYDAALARMQALNEREAAINRSREETKRQVAEDKKRKEELARRLLPNYTRMAQQYNRKGPVLFALDHLNDDDRSFGPEGDI